ncbi:MAG: 50S ribosomal protein L35 [Candidatus Hydrogenedentes bacterium]|nr:50S ribosomal protein L35 [Candidatus Hydrogenedentota bacterium]
MPKVKTTRGAAKRFRRTKNGLFKRSKSFRGHLKTSKSAKRRKGLRHPMMVDASDQKRVQVLLPYA